MAPVLPALANPVNHSALEHAESDGDRRVFFLRKGLGGMIRHLYHLRRCNNVKE